jgi:hypothetical protein
MTEQDISVLEDMFTDIKIEQDALYLALKDKDVPRETVEALRSEVDEKSIRDKVREQLIPALFSE